MSTTTEAPPAESTTAPRRYGGQLPLLGVAIPGRRTYRVWQRNRDVFFQLWRAELLPPLIEPIVMFLALGLGLGTYVQLTGDVDYIQFLAPGVLVIFPMFAAVFESLWGAYFRLDQYGTYEAILATPARPEEIIAGDIAWGATRCLINTALIIVVMAPFTPAFGLLQSPLVLLSIPLSLLVGTLFASLGIAYTSKARSISQLSYFFSLFILPMFWFSGGFFPLDELPGWAAFLAWLVPLSHAVDINRGLVSGNLEWSHLGDLVWLIVVTAPVFWYALWSMRRRLVQ